MQAAKNGLKSTLRTPGKTLLFILILTVVLPLSTLLIGSFKVNGNQEAKYIGGGIKNGAFTFHHWVELLTSKEYMYAVSRERRDFKIKTFRAMQRLPLPGWQVVKEGSRLGG